MGRFMYKDEISNILYNREKYVKLKMTTEQIKWGAAMQWKTI